MAPSAKANYKSFEAQARLIRAIVAAHPEVKWNYKEIAACYGSDMTDAALNHRFRRLRAEAVIISEGRKQDISKYFGQSTADGIQFQFRSIKKDADLLRQTAESGGEVATCPLPGLGGPGSAMSTPSKATPSRGAARKRKPASAVKEETTSDVDSELEEISAQDWSDRDAIDNTPSKKRTKTVTAMPSRTRVKVTEAAPPPAAAAAAAALKVEPGIPSVAPSSILGTPATATATADPPPPSLNSGSMDSLTVGGESAVGYGSYSGYGEYDFGANDDEI
ncbi:hypothetical protein GMORB2_3361 [Geosmithia morbida]|uniref:Uncharacterized protein n=1 Tax=Geosmithia morbida TaxID=1094350 RepID=A0A9P4YR31_9HYPO|nr:uncharacterized protein GMORB2_3361 [Geosmithia morbida]KAF4120234.1 hypothetical protein GMORB2_3361 [Geosmithia morbida]